MKEALFVFGQDGRYYPANKNSIAMCAILSKRVLDAKDMFFVRSEGYIPMTPNGIEIDKVDIVA